MNDIKPIKSSNTFYHQYLMRNLMLIEVVFMWKWNLEKNSDILSFLNTPAIPFSTHQQE